MNFVDSPRNLGWSLLGSVVAFALLLAGAVATFPRSYFYFRQKLSVLGRTELIGGTPNWPSALLFSGALLLAALASGIYFYRRSRMIASRPHRIALAAASLTGAVALAGVGLTPYNLLPGIHNGCSYVSVCLGLAILIAAGQPDSVFGGRGENLAWGLFTLFTGGVWLVLAYLLGTEQLPKTPTTQLMQKMIVLFFWLYLAFQAGGLIARTGGIRAGKPGNGRLREAPQSDR